MSKFYYGGILLPQLPQDKIEKYPFCLMRKNTVSGYYDLCMFPSVAYYKASILEYDNSDKIKNAYYRIPINNSSTYTEWTFIEESTGGLGIGETRPLIWSNKDVLNGSSTSSEIYFKGSEPIPEKNCRFLILEGDKYYTILDSTLSEVSITELNAQAFQDYGFDDLPDGALIQTLSHPKLLYWQSDDGAELPNITAKVIATPQGQYISKVIDMSDESISGINNVTVECAGTPWFSCSFDGGTTWMEYSGGSWIEVESYGMTEETLTAITSDEWSTATSGIDSFVMRVLLRSSSDSITNLSVNFLNET